MGLISNPDWLGTQLLVLVIVVLLYPKAVSSSNITSIKGKHLIILPTQLKNYMETRVNSSGYVIESNGSVPEMINWLSTRLKFDFVPSVTSLITDDTPTQRGKLSYLKNNEADMVIGAILITHKRFQQADFPMPWQWTSLGAVVPSPQTTTSFGALFYPWKIQIWIGVALAIPLFILSMYFLNKWLKAVRKLAKNQQEQHSKDSGYISLDSIIKYVFGVFLCQGAYMRNNVVVIRLCAAAWCLACFVLIQSYSCTLISFLTVPQFSKPIINSIYDVPKVKNLWVVTDRGMGTDSLLSTAESGIFKQFGTMLKNNPGLRCNVSQQCIDQVKSGSHVYVATIPLLDFAIQEDFKKNGVCHVTLLKERFMSTLLGFAVAKKSAYMEDLNRGIIELMEYGLQQYWDRKYVVPKKKLCHLENNNRPSVVKPRLSLTNLSSAFALLVFGYLVSLFVFLMEKIVHRIRRSHR